MRFFRPPAPKISLARPENAEELAELYARAWMDCDPLLDPLLVDDERASRDDLRTWLAGGFEVYRVEHDGRLAGAVRCSFPTSACHLDRLAVDPACRRRGLGRALVEHVIGRARRAGVARIWTEASPRLPASAPLLRSLGFREVGRYQPARPTDPMTLFELLL